MKIKKDKYLIVWVLSIVLWYGCSDITGVNSLEVEDQAVELAVPLINTTFSIDDLISDDPDDMSNVAIKIDDEDRVTLVYQGDVVRQDVNAVFPAVPSFPFPLLDTVYDVPVPFDEDQRVDRAIFGDTKIVFGFNVNVEQDVTVNVSIPQLTKDGDIFKVDVSIPFEGESPIEFLSDSISLKGWTLVDDDKKIRVTYKAITESGERIKFPQAAILFNNITFDYVEGYFGSEVFDINGDFIPIGVLDTWRSGGLAFEDPKVNILVENTFGFPVRSIFNTMQVITTTGEALDMESAIIDNNVDFAYPLLSEVGEQKITEFSFTKDNSNIVELFKERVQRVTYDIDAGANPDMDISIIGFINDDSYFLVSVDVELPLQGSINNLVLQDTIDLDFGDIPEADSVEFKNIFTNDFPANISAQSYFYDDENNLIDSLFTERLEIEAANVDPSTGETLSAAESVQYETFSGDRLQRLESSTKLLLNVKINTQQVDGDPLWIYNGYGIGLRVGAKVKATY